MTEFVDEYGATVALTALAGAAAAAYCLLQPRALSQIVPHNRQSVAVLFAADAAADADDVSATESGSIEARVSCLLEKPLADDVEDDSESDVVVEVESGERRRLMRRLYADCRTVYDIPRCGQRRSGDGRCLGWRDEHCDGRPYRWISYGRVLERARHLGAGLIAACQLDAGQRTLIGIYAQNRLEWALAEHACHCYSMISVALYDTLGADACHFIVTHGSVSVVLVDSEQRALLLLQRPPACLRHIIYAGGVAFSADTQRRASEAGVKLTSFEDVEAAGVASPLHEQPPRVSDIATISYTSGTTGEPKGVMLTHGGIVANVSAVLMQMGAEHRLRCDDTLLSFLPLSHTLERMCELAAMMQGASVGFYSGDVRQLMDDLQTLRPTAIPAVPRIFNRIYDKVWATAGRSMWRTAALRCALASKERELSAGVVRHSSLWDRLVLAPVRRSLGGRLRFVVVGSAPVAPAVLTFMRAVLGCVVMEGYGQTECVCPCTVTLPGDNSTGHVGAPLACCAVRLCDVPEMDYWAADGRGEVCVRGPTVFAGYFRNQEQTDQAIDGQGWLHTGDVGQWLSNGTLRIIDRKKNIFKLSQGEYVAPERLEDVYCRAALVSQVYVHGDSVQSCLVAIVVPEREALRAWALQHGHWEDTAVSELCSQPELATTVLQQLQHQANRAGLKGFEKIRAVHLHHEPLTMQNGMLTATLKARRHAINKHFRQQIDAMYDRLASQ